MAEDENSKDYRLHDTYSELWETIKEQGERKQELGKRLQKDGAFESDLAAAMLSADPSWWPSKDYEELLHYGHLLSQAQREQISDIENPINLNSTSVFSLVTTSTSLNATSLSSIEVLSPQSQESAEALRDSIDDLFTRHPKQEEVIDRMKKLGFEHRTDGQAAIKQFQSAWELHEQSPPTPTASLITMRSAVQSTIDELHKRKLQQGRTKTKEKIVKIGQQAAAPEIDISAFQQLQEEWGKLNDELSGSKSPKYARQYQTDLMNRATAFVLALLNAIDPTKLR